MKKCPVCGHENDDDMLFCHDCGEPLGEETVKPHHDEKTKKHDRFDSDTDKDDMFFGSGESFDDDEDDEAGDETGFDFNDDFSDDADEKDDIDEEDINDEPDDETDDTDEIEEDDDTKVWKPDYDTSAADTDVQEEEQPDTDVIQDNTPYDDTDVHEKERDDTSADDTDVQETGIVTDERYVSKKRKKETDGDGEGKKVRQGSVAGDIAFILIAVLLTATVVFLSVLYINKNYPGDTLNEKLHYIMTSSFTDDLITKQPTIEPDKTSDGEPAIRITVYARRGAYVVFREGATFMERKVEGQSIAFRVPTSLWTSAVKGEALESLDIIPNVFVYDPAVSNEVVQLEFTPYNATLESVDITLIAPSSDVFTTSSTSVPIEGRVSDNSVAVFMNGTQLQLDEDGYFRTVYYIAGDKSDEQEVVFTAQKSGYAIGKKVLVIKYNKSNINLEITSESLRTFEDTILVTGKVPRGVELSVKGVELDGELKINKSGEFSFTALVPSVGNYAVTFNMKDENGESATVIYLEHAPDKDEYISSTWTFDYEWLVKHSTMRNKHFGISGTIVEVYQTEPYVRAKLHTSSGDIIFTYYHTTEVATDDNKSYRIYCDPDGTDAETGLPQVYCWFIYKS